MEDFFIVAGTGLGVFVVGILLLRREMRLFANTVTTQAVVLEYDQYESTSGSPRRTMYTMNVFYSLGDGELIRAKEQSGSSRKKFPVGTEILVEYSLEKPDFFVVKGDKSRFIALWAMIVVGFLMMVVLGPALLTQGGLSL